MPTVSDQAVVLSRVDYSETSQIISFLTRVHGKVRAIAKGIKRGTKTRFAAGADLLDIGDIVVVTREERSPGLATLTEWKHSRSLMGLRERLMRIYAGQYCAEITAQLTEDWDPHPDLFDALTGALSALSDAEDVLESVVHYQVALLHAIGTLPRFDECVSCGREADISHFSSHEGGVICRHCEAQHVEKRAVSAASVSTIRSLLNEGPTAINPLNDEHCVGPFDVLDYHLTHLMGRPAALSEKLLPRSKRGAVHR